MFEKVNPSHPDKVADRIAGAIVDLGYKKNKNPKIACEVLIGHHWCNMIIETSVDYKKDELEGIVKRITGDNFMGYNIVIEPQDIRLANNQREKMRCGDNGIFKGVPITAEQAILTDRVKSIYESVPHDGKYIQDNASGKFIACQSHVKTSEWKEKFVGNCVINPLGDWDGGLDVDSGATNRKLGSDMGDAVTGGGIHGKDLSKADVSVNICCHVKAQESEMRVEALCAIGDEDILLRYYDTAWSVHHTYKLPYSEVVDVAKRYIDKIGGFEKLAEWGLIR